MTYDELVASIKTYTENTETAFVAEIPTFIAQAEEMIARQLPMAFLRAEDTGNFSASTRTITPPSDFLAPYGLELTDGNVVYQLYAKDEAFLREIYPDTTYEGRPRFYAINDDTTIVVAPTPDSAYAYTIRYYADPTGLSSGNQNTWIGDNAETPLLYGTLYHAYVFMKGSEDLMANYKELFMGGLEGMAKLGGERQKVDQFKRSEVQL